jgi:hypothetical protein
MPKGIHNNHKGGTKPTCSCGDCKKCKGRIVLRQWRMKVGKRANWKDVYEGIDWGKKL